MTVLGGVRNLRVNVRRGRSGERGRRVTVTVQGWWDQEETVVRRSYARRFTIVMELVNPDSVLSYFFGVLT